MESLPFEVLLQVFEYLPISNFSKLYQLFPQAIVDEALVYKLRHTKSKPIIDLISTNLHELSANKVNKRNESSVSLYFASYDASHRFIWTLPDFNHAQHYFKVKDAYVSHGKLVLRQPHDNNTIQKPIVSLWDIRKSFPPTRAGSFSGASEYSRIKSQELTIQKPGCILDSCLIPCSATTTVANNSNIKVVSNGSIKEDKRSDKREEGPKRPSLPMNYQREIPSGNNGWNISDPTTCGYFLVERLAISIPTFLELFSSA